MATVDTKQIELLLEQAQNVSERAYVPFSNFRVGAAVLAANGSVYTGCNVENSSYGLTNCAERTAIFTAVADGALAAGQEIVAIAVVNREGNPCSPCGACRQVIYEFGPEAIVIYREKTGQVTQAKASDLLPEGFRLER